VGEYARRNGKIEVRFYRSRPQAADYSDHGCNVLWIAIDCGALQLAGRCGSCSTGTTEFGSGGAAWRARNSKQEAAAFYNCAGATTVAG